MIVSEVPGSIEGEQILITGLKIEPKGRPIIRRELPNEILYQVTVQRRGDGTIEKEYPYKDRKKKVIKKTSLLELGSKISGTDLWGLSTEMLRPTDIHKGGKGRSGRHTGQHVTINGICFMELIHGWRGDALPTHPREQLM